IFSEIVIGIALIQSPRHDEPFVNTAWTLQIARGTLVCVLCVALAGPLAALYGEESLAGIVRLVGVGAIIGSLQSTKYVTLNRALVERPRAILELANSVVTRIAMIAVALIWPTAYALVLGTLAGAAFFTIATHFLTGPKNRFAWDPTAARALMRFGTWVV